MNLRSVLLDALRERLFPEIVRAGLTGPDAEEVAIDDIAPPPRADLFHFRGCVGSTRVAITINVKSFSRPTFTVVAGQVPPHGVKRWCPEEVVPADRATADMLEVQAYLQASPSPGYRPFRPSLGAWIVKSESATIAAVDRAATLLPHLIGWLRGGEASRYVRVVRFPRPGAKLPTGS